MYTAKDYTSLLGLNGFSDKQLTIHFGLYEGYVKNTNKELELLQQLAVAGDIGTSYAEVKRRLGWEFDGMRMHEYYFENMTKDASPLGDGELRAKIEADFGSFDAWQKEFESTGALRGIGWAVLVYDMRGDRLHNIWVNEHDMGHLVGTTPLLVMDVFEHAFVFDYDMKRAEYIASFMSVIDWNEVTHRFESAVTR